MGAVLWFGAGEAEIWLARSACCGWRSSSSAARRVISPCFSPSVCARAISGGGWFIELEPAGKSRLPGAHPIRDYGVSSRRA
jgi:hypothetical protein